MVLTEIIENALEQNFETIQIFNPMGKDLAFKGVELIRLENRKEQPVEGLPLNGSILVYMTDKDNFVIVDDRNNEKEGPTVLKGKHELTFGCYGYDRIAKELYKRLGIDSYLYV